MAVTYNNNNYYYATNLQGDVVAILDTSGNAVVTYMYDAWGNILETKGSLSSSLGVHNPLRYRGYVYDEESKLYYLQSRYYDPEMGRFISSDTYPSTGQGLLGNNMFAYCNNSPVAFADSSGAAAETVLDIISLANSISDVISNPSNPWAWAGLIGDLVDVAVPCMGGIGETVKALGKIQKTAEAYGDLSRASEFGVKAYNTLKKVLKGTGLEAHHVIEKRLVRYLDIDPNTMLSVAVTRAEHQNFTNAWRGLIKYGTDYRVLTKDDIYTAATMVYKDYPELLKAAYETLYD